MKRGAWFGVIVGVVVGLGGAAGAQNAARGGGAPTVAPLVLSPECAERTMWMNANYVKEIQIASDTESVSIGVEYIEGSTNFSWQPGDAAKIRAAVDACRRDLGAAPRR